MKLNEVIDLSNQPVKHAEIKYPSMYDNKKDLGKKRKTKISDVVVRDTKTGKIYGRRAIAQRT